MEKKRISNFSILFFVIIALFCVVAVKTVLVIKEKHEDRLIYSMHSNAEYYAKRCYLDNKCQDEITIQTLYDLKYLKYELVNPITKEVIDPNTKVRYENEKITIDWIN